MTYPIPAPHRKNLCVRRGRQLLAVLGLLLASVTVKAQQAAFTYTTTPASQCSPTTISFRNTSSGTPISLVWDFGNGRSSREANPVITFDTPGPVTITLMAYYPNSSSSSSLNLTIYASPMVNFSVDRRISCGNYTATFTDLTPGAVTRTWDFGDGSAPVTVSTNTIQHTYNRADTFDVTLTVTNATACTQTLKQSDLIVVSYPAINISNTNLQGCVPFDATLAATITSINNDPVTSYAWTFGDNSSGSSNTPVATHRYNSAGNFDVTLAVTTQQGCTATRTFSQLVKTGTPPGDVTFTATRADNCAGTSARLLATATNANMYRWNFGDGTTLEGTDYDVDHVFQRGGNVTIQLAAGSNGCFANAPAITLNNIGPVANFGFERLCDNKMAIRFNNISTGSAGDTYEWDFDDGSALSNDIQPQHTYTNGGTYTVRLTVRNTAQQCVSTLFKTIQVFAADFHTGVGTICRNSDVPYGVLHVPNTLVSTYDWRFGDGTRLVTTEDDIMKKVTAKGVFTDTLIIRYNDPAYCADTIVKPNHLSVIAPLADFSAPPLVCEGQQVSLTGMSLPSPNIPLTDWQWDFGNGTRSASETPAATRYNSSGSFPVKLVVTDARNCKDSVTRNIVISPTPIIHAVSPQSKLCEGSSITLESISNATVQWQPNYQISCVNCNDPVVTPLKDTSYIAIATNVYGCTARDTVSIQVVPQVVLGVSADTAICKGSLAQLRAWGATNYSWTPRDTTIIGPDMNLPVVKPGETTRYTVSATNDASCPSVTASINITVHPAPTVNAGADQTVTAGSIVQLTGSHSNDVVSLTWKPNDYLDCMTCLNTSSNPRESMDYSLEVVNNLGCKATDVMHIKLVCDQSSVFFPNGFSPNGDGMNDIFYPRGRGIRIVKSMRIFNRLGQEVFKRTNFNIEDPAMGWNGSFNGRELASDVFIYLVELLCDSNETFQLKGNVTLLR